MYHFFATTAKGLEGLLEQELQQLDITETRQTVAGVHFKATLPLAYAACLWLRTANRVLLKLTEQQVYEADGVYQAAMQIQWPDHFTAEQTFRIDFHGTNRSIQHSHFGALKIKDAVVDQFREQFGQRPSVDKQPDIIIHAYLSRTTLVISLDFSGDSLHRRGYRTDSGAAPLKENLAAGILMRSGWWLACQSSTALFFDPLCGSGTLLIEAALMALDIAPGLMPDLIQGDTLTEKRRFGFHQWASFDPAVFAPIYQAAWQRSHARPRQKLIYGQDHGFKVLEAARANIERAGLHEVIQVEQRSVEDFKAPEDWLKQSGWLVTNPPYGERLMSEPDQLIALYQALGQAMKQLTHWHAAVFTGASEFGRFLGLRSTKQYKLFNGAIPCKLLLFVIEPDHFYQHAATRQTLQKPAPSAQSSPLSDDLPTDLSDGAQMLVNRLQKNQKQLKKWLKTAQTDAYRLYDSDMPEYAVAVDLYADHVHVQEYKAPKSIDEAAAAKRFNEVRQAVPVALDIPLQRIAFKQRQRQKGRQQYQPRQSGQSGHRGSSVKPESLTVYEGQARFKVDLHSYLDTGLFLDHRPLRRLIYEQAQGKSLLNLFCYTAAITVQAGLGGARRSLSLDMSNTYLKWAEDNFRLNRLNLKNHQLKQTDCLVWLQDQSQQKLPAQFDLVVLDPPTFSNSKRMDDVLDIQRDHVTLVQQAMHCVKPKGQLYFSNNFRGFKLDPAVSERYVVDNISAQTLDPDFKRNPQIHHCYRITHLL